VTGPIEERIQSLLQEDERAPSEEQIVVALGEGYTRALQLDAERLTLERRITALAARAEDPDAAQELRRTWLRHRTINGELRELRLMLRRLKDARRAG
jgi:hypothetical protein